MVYQRSGVVCEGIEFGNREVPPVSVSVLSKRMAVVFLAYWMDSMDQLLQVVD